LTLPNAFAIWLFNSLAGALRRLHQLLSKHGGQRGKLKCQRASFIVQFSSAPEGRGADGVDAMA
jgi:hypothetical protein